MLSLTADQKAFFKENGYLVLNDTLTDAQVEAGVDAIWPHLNADRDDPSTWVGAGPVSPKCGDDPAILATLYNSPAYEAAESLVGKGKLTRPSSFGPKLNFPTGDTEWAPPCGGHLDGYYTPTNGVPEGTVGRFFVGVTMYLSHQHPTGGGFTIWPGTHLQSAEYFRTHAMLSVKGGSVHNVYDLPEAVEITGPPGTVCLWHGDLVHSASKNCRPDIRLCMITRLNHIDRNDILFEWPDDPWTYWDGIE